MSRWNVFAKGSLIAVAIVVAIAVAWPLTRPSTAATGASSSSQGAAVPATEGRSSADSAPWPDGLPRVLDGMPVYRGGAISAHAAAVNDDSPFLIGGYLINVEGLCAPSDLPTNPLVSDCPNGWMLQDTASYPPVLDGSAYIPLTVGVNVTSVAGAWSFVSPQVLRVHAFDAAADSCPASILQRCRHAMVVDAVVWVGRIVVGPGASATPQAPSGSP